MGRVYASRLPKILDQICDEYVAYADRLDAEHPDVAAGVRREAHDLRGDDTALWWVAAPMVKLARTAAPTMPEWTPHQARPSRFGILWWDGGPGISLGDTPVDGVLWCFDRDGTMSLVCLREDGGQIELMEDVGSMWRPDGKTGGLGPKGSLWRIVGATWLLALSPKVGRQYGVRFNRRDPERPFAKPSLPGVITTVTLRKNDAGQQIHDPDEQPQHRPGPDHQFIVRGHWRQQACGPKRAWRKPLWIAPFVKGPDGTDLVVKPEVHVWRR